MSSLNEEQILYCEKVLEILASNDITPIEPDFSSSKTPLLYVFPDFIPNGSFKTNIRPTAGLIHPEYTVKRCTRRLSGDTPATLTAKGLVDYVVAFRNKKAEIPHTTNRTNLSKTYDADPELLFLATDELYEVLKL